MDTIIPVILIAATLLTGLLAGFYYAWSCSVMPGLKGTDDRTFITAMQKINIAILNPAFMLIFIGPLIAIALSIILLFIDGGVSAAICALVALIGVIAEIAITARQNQPMNIALDAAGTYDDLANPRETRAQFEAPWVRWNHLRTATSTLAFLLMLGSLTLYLAG